MEELEVFRKTDGIPGGEKNKFLFQQYVPTNMQKDLILKSLAEKGGRITKQREILIDIILKGECMNCKEIYYKAAKQLPHIGMATIYRTVGTLEEIGALERRNIRCMKVQEPAEASECVVHLEDDTMIRLDAVSLNRVIERGMQDSGMLKGRRVRNVLVKRNEMEVTD